ncbi:MAG: aldehyde dehydrogenase family protein [Lentisphaeria bacterium]
MPQTNIEFTVSRLRKSFASGRTQPLSWRRSQLHGLLQMFKTHAPEFTEALRDDLDKPVMESRVSETGYVQAEIKYALKHLKKWAAPQSIFTPLRLRPGKAWIQPEPYGTALIIGPWNFPVQLALTPLIAAVAAGNCAILKPSEIAPATSALLARRLPEYLDREAIAVIEGDADTAKLLLKQKFDYIFYTGNPAVGRKVMAAASEHLTPVTLELGGKCPCIVDDTCDIKVAARRIVWGKYLNAGQTCVAPDYLLVQKSIEPELVDLMCRAISDFYGNDPQASPDYGRIVSDKHFQRLTELLTGKHEIITGGGSAAENRFIEPTIVRETPLNGSLMQDEIFGPILPVLNFQHLQEAVEFVNQRPKPLALYLFSSDRHSQNTILEHTSAGGVCINDTIMQLGAPPLPFGGVGESGMGRYHGKAGFDTFSNAKTILKRRTWFDPSLRYPPYG